MVRIEHLAGLRARPAGVLRGASANFVFGAKARAPGKVVIDLDEVVVTHDRILRLHATEEVLHAAL